MSSYEQARDERFPSWREVAAEARRETPAPPLVYRGRGPKAPVTVDVMAENAKAWADYTADSERRAMALRVEGARRLTVVARRRGEEKRGAA